MTRPLILVTNDDGIRSGGLRAAAEAARTLGDVLIVAPEKLQTGMGRSFPRTEREGIIEVLQGQLSDETVPYYAVSGSPAQAVAHGVLEIALRRSALCISGINDGENLGGTNLISGTVGAALEATSFGIPALAVSLGPEDPDLFAEPYREADWQTVSGIIRQFAAMILKDGLPSQVSLLNINIPSSATPQTPIRVTSQSRQSHYVCAKPRPRDLSKPFRLPVAESIDFATLEPDSDLYAFFVDRVVSVTPMSGDLTVRDAGGAPLNILTKA
jgi:5'-nucleotidase